MVGFVHNHPDRPFVMGGMFHGGTALGGGSNNSVKSIMTRSGHKVIFTEDESIIITDKSGNEIHLDTNISTSAGNNISINAGNDITETAVGNRMEMANNRTEMIDETVLWQS